MIKNIKLVKNNNLDFIKLCEELEYAHQNVIKEQRAKHGNCLNNLDTFATILLYYIDNIAVGCMAMTNPVNDKAEIGRVYVKEEYRQQKIAYQLFNCIIEEARKQKIKILKLDTYSRFKAAVNMYKKFGFYEVNNYIEDSPYSLCMQKDLDYNEKRVVGTMFFDNQKLLIDKPRKRPTYQMIGGSVEMGETIYQAAIRECHEELGNNAIFDEQSFELIMDFEEIATSDNTTHIHFYVFKCNDILKGKLQTSAEIEKFLWYDTTNGNDILSNTLKHQVIPYCIKNKLIK